MGLGTCLCIFTPTSDYSECLSLKGQIGKTMKRKVLMESLKDLFFFVIYTTVQRLNSTLGRSQFASHCSFQSSRIDPKVCTP